MGLASVFCVTLFPFHSVFCSRFEFSPVFGALCCCSSVRSLFFFLLCFIILCNFCSGFRPCMPRASLNSGARILDDRSLFYYSFDHRCRSNYIAVVLCVYSPLFWMSWDYIFQSFEWSRRVIEWTHFQIHCVIINASFRAKVLQLD